MASKKSLIRLEKLLNYDDMNKLQLLNCLAEYYADRNKAKDVLDKYIFNNNNKDTEIKNYTIKCIDFISY